MDDRPKTNLTSKLLTASESTAPCGRLEERTAAARTEAAACARPGAAMARRQTPVVPGVCPGESQDAGWKIRDNYPNVPLQGNCSVVSTKINSTESISRETISAHVNSSVSVTVSLVSCIHNI